MPRTPPALLLLCALSACDAPATPPAPAADPKLLEEPPAAKSSVQPGDKPVVTEPPVLVKDPAAIHPTPSAASDEAIPLPDVVDPPAVADEAPPEPKALPPGEEIELAAMSAISHEPTWTPKTPPTKRLVFANDVYAGVMGKAGDSWMQEGPDGELVPLTMDREPTLPITGVWPDDAWMVESRSKRDDTSDYQELRLMRLRGGRRWVPQSYGSNEQWFHPGTGTDGTGRAEYDAPHTSTRSGMLMYPETFESLTRVGGKHEEPYLGPHRGVIVDFLETGRGRVYLLSNDDGTYYAQTECQDEECVVGAAKRLPLNDWRFERRVARGKYTASVLAQSGDRVFLLHHRGKTGGWLLEEIPADEKPTGAWSSTDGGLWTQHADGLKWRDTEGVWRDVALPKGLAEPSVALSNDGSAVWVAGTLGGSPSVFTTQANTEPVAP